MCEYEETLLRLKENKIKGEPSYIRACLLCVVVFVVSSSSSIVGE